MRTVVCSLLPLALLTLAGGVRADGTTERHTLAGLRTVHVELQLQGDDLEAALLTEAVLRPVVEAKLAAAGLGLAGAEESARVPGVPWVFVGIGTQKSTDAKVYAWSARVRLVQRACLERDPSVCESVTTWESQRFGSVGRRRVKTLRQDVDDLVNQFVGAWLAANPRR